MADLSIKINADFKNAVDGFKELAANTEGFSKKMEAANQNFASKDVEEFINKQKLASVAITAVKGDTAAVAAETRAYESKIQSLIKSGLDPESEQVQKLNTHLVELKDKQAAAADAAKALADEQKRTADITVSLLGVTDDFKKENIELAQSQKDVEDKIRSLISNGMSPEDAQIKALEADHKKLTKEIKENQSAIDMQEKAAKGAATALKAIGAAVAAAGAAAVALTQKTATMGNEFAKQARVIGTDAESLQELEYAARLSGVSQEKLVSALEKTNKTVAEVRDGQGTLYNSLKDTNAELLDSIANAKDTDDAFMIMMDAVKNTGDEMERAKLATELFGKSGQDLILMADAGVDGLAALRQEARDYGIITNENAKQSEAYLDAQDRVKQAMTGMGNAIGGKLMPGLTDLANKVAGVVAEFVKWIGEGDNFERVINIAKYALAGLTAGLVAFLVVTKGAAAVTLLKEAIHGLTAAIAANPIGAFAVVITSLVIPAIISLADEMKTTADRANETKEALNKLKEGFDLSTSEGRLDKMNAELTVQKNLLVDAERELKTLIQTQGEYDYLFEEKAKAIQNAEKEVERVRDLIAENNKNIDEEKELARLAEEKKIREEAMAATAKTYQLERDAANKSLEEQTKKYLEQLEEIKIKTDDNKNDELQLLDLEFQRTQAAINATDAEQTRKDAAIAAARAVYDEKVKLLADEELSLKDQIARIAETEAQKYQDDIETYQTFLQQRLDAENFAREMSGEAEVMNAEERKAWLEEQGQLTLEQLGLEGEARIAAEQAIGDSIKRIIGETTEAKVASNEEVLASTADMFGSMSSLVKAAGKENRAAAVAAKMLDMAQAGINSALAFTKTLADGPPFPLNVIAAGSILASGLAQQIQIASTPIPSAETGLRDYVIPDVSAQRLDNVGVAAQPGERVNITPRGESGGARQTIQLMLDGTLMVKWINSKIESGDIQLGFAV